MTTNQQLVANMTLVHAFAWRVAQARGDYPTMTIFWKPDAAHLDEHSDHNPDSRDIGHAVDYMTYGDETKAAAILAWHAADRTDQEYVIHDDRIYRRSHGFASESYVAVDPGRTDPHTNHVHVSFRHANPGVGENSLTGTGYYGPAESHQATGSPLDPTGDNDMATIDSISPAAAATQGKADAAALVNQELGHSTVTVGIVLQRLPAQLDALKASIDALPAAIAAALAPPPTV